MIRYKTLFCLVLCTLAYLQFLYRFAWIPLHEISIDLPSFYCAARSVFLLAQSPYGPEANAMCALGFSQNIYPFLYLPHSLLLLAPLSLLPYEAIKVVVLLLNHLLTLFIAYLLFTKIVRVKKIERFTLYFIIFCFFAPLGVNYGHGQINLFVLVLLLLFWHGYKDRQPNIWLGLVLSLMIALKTYPLIFLPFLAIKQNWGVIRWTIYHSLIMLVLATIVLPREIWLDWHELTHNYGGYIQDIYNGLHSAAYWNQSLNGFFSRLLTNNYFAEPVTIHMPLAKILTGGIALYCLYITISKSRTLTLQYRDQYVDYEIGLFLCCLYLIAPFSWEHHLVFLLAVIYAFLEQVLNRTRPRTVDWLIISSILLITAEIPFFSPSLQPSPLSLLISAKFYGVLLLFACLLAIPRITGQYVSLLDRHADDTKKLVLEGSPRLVDT